MKRDTSYKCPTHCPWPCHKEYSMSVHKANIMPVFGRRKRQVQSIQCTGDCSSCLAGKSSRCYQYPAIDKPVFVRLFVIGFNLFSSSYIYTQF